MSQNPQPPAISSLIAELGDHDGLTRRKAREALVAIGPSAVPALLRAFDRAAGQERWEVVKALGDLADPASAPALVKALEDREFSVRWLAAEGLTAIGRRSIEPLLEALVHHGTAVWLREGAHHVLKALAKRGLPKAVEPLLQALEGLEPELTVPPAAKSALKALQGSDE